MAKPTMRVPSSSRRKKKDQKGRTGRLETFNDPSDPTGSRRFDRPKALLEGDAAKEKRMPIKKLPGVTALRHKKSGKMSYVGGTRVNKMIQSGDYERES